MGLGPWTLLASRPRHTAAGRNRALPSSRGGLTCRAAVRPGWGEAAPCDPRPPPRPRDQGVTSSSDPMTTVCVLQSSRGPEGARGRQARGL